MSLVKITSEGITDGSIVNADLHSAANIALSKLADSGVTAGSYGSATAIPAITLNAKGIITSVSTNSVNTTTNLGISTGTDSVTITSSTGNNAQISEATGSAAGVMSVAHHDKLDGIEASATADQTASEIRTLVGNASDSNVFTDALLSKLNGIEASATGDQSASEIRALVESASDSNVFTDADHSKLNGIASGATNVTNNNQITNGRGFTTFDGNYNSLSNKPTIPTNNNQLTNGAGYITSASDSTKLPLSGGELSGNLITHQIRPDGNGNRELGTSSFRWQNIYTSDLDLSNEGSSNDVDGTWGSYTIQEGKDSLFLLNKRNGKKYKFNLTEVS